MCAPPRIFASLSKPKKKKQQKNKTNNNNNKLLLPLQLREPTTATLGNDLTPFYQSLKSPMVEKNYVLRSRSIARFSHWGALYEESLINLCYMWLCNKLCANLKAYYFLYGNESLSFQIQKA